jgi:hypothetical protein
MAAVHQYINAFNKVIERGDGGDFHCPRAVLAVALRKLAEGWRGLGVGEKETRE